MILAGKSLPTEGELLPLARKVAGAPDPLALYAALCDEGRRPDTLLLESADVVTRLAERSFLIPRAAAAITCRDRAVRVEARTPGGRALLPGWPPGWATTPRSAAATTGSRRATCPPGAPTPRRASARRRRPTCCGP